MQSTIRSFDLAHLAHLEILTPKPDESLNFFVNVLGMTETGGTPGDNALCYGEPCTFVWTNTREFGTQSQFKNSCINWTSTAEPVGETGNWKAKDGAWTMFGSLPCSSTLRLYCFQQ